MKRLYVLFIIAGVGLGIASPTSALEKSKHERGKVSAGGFVYYDRDVVKRDIATLTEKIDKLQRRPQDNARDKEINELESKLETLRKRLKKAR